MSTSLYRYTEDCDGVPCPGDCDACNRNIQSNLFDIEEIHENCTVQILKNSITGEISIGWWENELQKEKKSLNGEVTTYSMNERIPWKQFKFIPVDIQREYIDKLIANGGGAMDICEYLNCGKDTFLAWCRANGVHFSAGKRKAEDKKRWAAFIQPEKQPESKPEIKPEAKPETGLDNLAEILKALVGTGAKLTIEVTL